MFCLDAVFAFRCRCRNFAHAGQNQNDLPAVQFADPELATADMDALFVPHQCEQAAQFLMQRGNDAYVRV